MRDERRLRIVAIAAFPTTGCADTRVTQASRSTRDLLAHRRPPMQRKLSVQGTRRECRDGNPMRSAATRLSMNMHARPLYEIHVDCGAAARHASSNPSMKRTSKEYCPS